MGIAKETDLSEITQFIDDLYLSIDSMANGRVPSHVTPDQFKKLKALGLPNQNSKVTIWRAIKYLENYDGKNNDSLATGST